VGDELEPVVDAAVFFEVAESVQGVDGVVDAVGQVPVWNVDFQLEAEVAGADAMEDRFRLVPVVVQAVEIVVGVVVFAVGSAVDQGGADVALLVVESAGAVVAQVAAGLGAA
jgi:hypothetical protein